MQERHTNRKKYFSEQIITVEKYVIPFIEEVKPLGKNTSVLEIGCGEGGNLVPFFNLGCERIVGIDILDNKINLAKEFFGELEGGERTEFICEDIYNIDDIGQFDLIIMRDVIEHIHNQEKFMAFVKKFLKPDGRFFLGFPPWSNPFGGHQQICESKVLSKLPFFHLLPRFMYKGVLKMFGEKKERIEGLLEVKDTGINTERFERILKAENYQKDKHVYYFINPNYETKFGLKPRVCWKLFSAIPYVRNFFVTANYYVISKGAEK